MAQSFLCGLVGGLFFKPDRLLGSSLRGQLPCWTGSRGLSPWRTLAAARLDAVRRSPVAISASHHHRSRAIATPFHATGVDSREDHGKSP
ncbi:hypothetical protein V6N11_069478 [Hibiscus sabdariffa]|uniref:Secreted protein n=1 Tax=Hibiscus sabdariffa TaxID=183260 RepID=A0ABR2Q3I6_9ROSI